MNSLELIDAIEVAKDSAEMIISTAEKECRKLSDKEQTQLNELRETIKALRAQQTDNNNISKTIMTENFSIIKAIRNVANNRAQDSISQAVIEAGANEMRKAGLNYVGQIQLPSAEVRAITVANEGEDIVATDLFDVVAPLQKSNALIQAGAKFVTGLIGDVKYPVMNNANVTWEGEIAKAGDGNITFKHVKLSPKRLTVEVPISKQFLLQDSVGAEQAIRAEIVKAISAKLEATLLGDEIGTDTKPAGLFYTTETLPVVSDFSALADVESELDGYTSFGEPKYILSPKAKASLRTMPKGEASGMVFANGEVDGTKALTTAHVAGKKFVYGDFSQYVIGQWGNTDLTVDTVTLAGEGSIRLVVNAYFDAKPLRPEALVVATL